MPIVALFSIDPGQPDRPAAAGRVLGKDALIFSALVEAKLWTVLVIGRLEYGDLAVYYLRVVKIMTIDPEPENRVAGEPGVHSRRLFVVAMTAADRDPGHLVERTERAGPGGRQSHLY